MHFPSVEEQILHLRRGVQEIISEEELHAKLQKSAETGKPLTVKLGCDPSRPDLHLGHAVVLRKLRQFQDFGHEIVLIIGDFTGMIGDASGRSKMRPALSLEETRRNGETYFQQASRVLSPERIRIVYNSEWLGKLSFEDVVRLAGKTTVARMLERDDFSGRYVKGNPIGVHEFLYPLAQAQDSVEVRADVELGGTDQKFNLLMGRSLQRSAGQESQVCITLPILEGLDGTEKMSKSLDNYVGLSESAETMYGKILSIPDTLIYRYFELASDEETGELPALRKLCEEAPRDAKHRLALSVTRLYHGAEQAKQAREHFERTVIRKETPEDVPSFKPDSNGSVGLLSLLTMSGVTSSNGEARRLVEQGAVSIDGQKVTDSRMRIDIAVQAPFLIKAGKRRFVQIVQ